MKQYALVFTLFFSVVVLRGQNPGMLGRTLLVSGGADLFAYLGDWDSSAGLDNTFEDTAPKFGLRYRLEFGKTLRRGLEVGVHLSRSTFRARGTVTSRSTAFSRDDLLPIRGTRQAALLTLRWFPKSSGGIAPAGFYWRLVAGVQGDTYSYFAPPDEGPDIGKNFSLGLYPQFGAGLGYRYALTDQLLLELGFTVEGGRGDSITDSESLLGDTVRQTARGLQIMDSFRLLFGVAYAL